MKKSAFKWKKYQGNFYIAIFCNYGNQSNIIPKTKKIYLFVVILLNHLVHSFLTETKLLTHCYGGPQDCTKMKFSLKNFFIKCDKFTKNCGFGHMYWRNPYCETSFFCALIRGLFELLLSEVKTIWSQIFYKGGVSPQSDFQKQKILKFDTVAKYLPWPTHQPSLFKKL